MQTSRRMREPCGSVSAKGMAVSCVLLRCPEHSPEERRGLQGKRLYRGSGMRIYSQ